MNTFKGKEEVLFETIDLEINEWIHKSYLKVDSTYSQNVMPDSPGLNIQQEEQIQQQIQRITD